jgi:hypothetical protein
MIGRDEGHRLALVANHVLGEHRLVGVLEPAPVSAGDVVVGEYGVHAGSGQRLADADRRDPRGRMRAAQRCAPQHAVHPQVAAVGELAGDLEDPVWPGRAVADATRRSGDPVRGADRRRPGVR